jgi:hypothetical protein
MEWTEAGESFWPRQTIQKAGTQGVIIRPVSDLTTRLAFARSCEWGLRQAVAVVAGLAHIRFAEIPDESAFYAKGAQWRRRSSRSGVLRCLAGALQRVIGMGPIGRCLWHDQIGPEVRSRQGSILLRLHDLIFGLVAFGLDLAGRGS